MTTIKVKPGQLLAISKQFEEAHYQVSQMTNRLKQRIVEIEQMWDGSTKENFYANFIYAQQAMDKFLDGSITISKELERHAEKFKNADNQSLETYGSPESNDAKAPAADTRNAFQKSADSIVELGQAFLQSADDRYQKRYDSVGGFLDYWTFGIPSGLVSGYVDRAEKAFNSPNDAANWITFGIHGTIREATFPTNAWSSEHWANIFGVGGLMLGGGYASSMMKPHNLFTGGGPKINPSTRPGTGNMTGGFNGFQDQRMRVTENIAESKKARESSKFSEFVEKEKEIGKGTRSALVEDTGRLVDNTANLRTWAEENTWVRHDTAGGVEQWGVKDNNGTFSWRLKLKPEASRREGLGAGSNQPRFDARLDDKGTYINPFTGETGGRSVGTHIPLGE